MDASWTVWIISAVVFVGAVQFSKSMPGSSDFRRVVVAVAILGLAVAAARESFRWHLVWFTPVAIVGAYLYGLRRLFALSHRVNKITKSGIGDPEQIRRALQKEVDQHNRDAPDDQKLR